MLRISGKGVGSNFPLVNLQQCQSKNWIRPLFQQGTEVQQLGIGCVYGFFQGTIHRINRHLPFPCSNHHSIFACESGPLIFSPSLKAFSPAHRCPGSPAELSPLLIPQNTLRRIANKPVPEQHPEVSDNRRERGIGLAVSLNAGLF
jgi:hypothetical protein